MRASSLLALCLLAALGAASCDDLGGSVALANEPGLGVAAMMVAPGEAAKAPPEEAGEAGEGEESGEEIAAAVEREDREGLDDAGASGGQGESLPLDPQDLAALDAPYTELIRRFRQPRQPGSVGTTLRGRLHGAAALEVSGEHHAILPECVERATRFGTPDLVDLLLRAAEITHTTHGGPRLMIGNLSFEAGGNIPWSRSHNSGLDADLAFFVLKDGQPEEAPSLMRFGGRLNDLDELGYTFDVPRNWTLIKSLLTHPTVEVQWLFIARPLRRAVLEHARAQGEDPALLLKAETVLRQPMDAQSHNDHLHVRVFCPAQDRVEGCVQKEPVWPWVNTQQRPTLIRAAALAAGLRDPKREVREAVLSKLDDLPGYFAAPAVAAAWLSDPSDAVRQRSWELLLQWDERSVGLGAALEAVIRAPGADDLAVDDPAFTALPPAPGGDPPPLRADLPRRDGRTLRAAWRLVGALGLRDAAPLVSAGLRSQRMIRVAPDLVLPEAQMAAEASRHLMDLRLVPALLEALGHERPEVREPAARTLERLANHAPPGDRWDRHATAEQLRDQRQRWAAWWAERADRSRDDLLLAGFQRVQPAIQRLDADAIGHLIHLTERRDVIGYNADHALRQLTGRWAPREATAEQRHKHWSHASAEAAAE